MNDENDKKKRADYTVGYKKPPSEYRFQKGESGNPSGRPKKPKTLAGLLCWELKKKITITENGVPQEITKAEGLVKRVVNDGIKGDRSAFNSFIKFMKHLGLEEDSGFFEGLDDEGIIVVTEDEEDEENSTNKDRLN